MLERLALSRAWFVYCVPCSTMLAQSSHPLQSSHGKCGLPTPCAGEYLAAFIPNTTLGEFLAHLPFMKTPLAKLGIRPHTQPSPGCSFVPSLQCISGLQTYMPVWTSSRTHLHAAGITLLSLLFPPSIPVSTCPHCGILGAVCGCLAPPAVEGEYCPWDRELLQGQWLQHLSKEEEMGTCEGTRLASCPSPPRLPSSHLKYASKSRPHMEGLFCKAVLKGSGHT